MAAEAITINITNLSQSSIVLPEGYADAAEFPQDRTVRQSDFGLDEALNQDSTPKPAAIVSVKHIFDSAGEIVLDFTAAPTVGATDAQGRPTDLEDLTGRKLFHYEFFAPDGNSNSVFVASGDTNGLTPYPIWDNQPTSSVELRPNSKVALTHLNSLYAVVSASRKNIRALGQQNDTINLILAFE